MNTKNQSLLTPAAADVNALTTELLILPDGRILVHNLTGPFAKILHELNPGEEQIGDRINETRKTRHEFPN